MIILNITDHHPQVIQNGGFELNGGGDPGLDHWNKRGCQMSAEQWEKRLDAAGTEAVNAAQSLLDGAACAALDGC